jgi:hypothetical protein
MLLTWNGYRPRGATWTAANLPQNAQSCKQKAQPPFKRRAGLVCNRVLRNEIVTRARVDRIIFTSIVASDEGVISGPRCATAIRDLGQRLSLSGKKNRDGRSRDGDLSSGLYEFASIFFLSHCVPQFKINVGPVGPRQCRCAPFNP